MNRIDSQLIELITEEVLKAFSRGEGGNRTDTPTAIRPPLGTCTGDYSRFTDRPDLSPTTSANSSGPAQTSGLAGIVTAQQLEEAIHSSPDKVATLAHDARLTPLANDFVRENPQKVRRAAPTGTFTSPANGAPWLWWADGHYPAAQQAAVDQGGALIASGVGRSDTGLVQVVRETADGLRSRSLSGGILFVTSAARAGVLANRCPLIRAVVGTCLDALEQGIRQVGANLLIIEAPYVDGPTICKMLQRVSDTKPNISAHVQRELAEFHQHR